MNILNLQLESETVERIVQGRLTSVSDVIKKFCQRWRILKAFLCVIFSCFLNSRATEYYTYTKNNGDGLQPYPS